MTEKQIFIALLAASLLFACQPARRLSEGELLLTGVGIQTAAPAKGLNEGEAAAQLRQSPNAAFLGTYPRLGIHNAFHDKKKGIGKWIREKLGQPPVTFDPDRAELDRLRLEKWMQDEGFLQAEAQMDTAVRKARVEVSYQLYPGPRYRVDSVSWPTDTRAISQLLLAMRSEVPLQPGRPYRIRDLNATREQLAAAGQDAGFFGLSRQQFFYYVDTLPGQQSAIVSLRLSPPPQGQPFQKHYLGRTYIFPTYQLGEESSGADTTYHDGLIFIQQQQFVSSQAIARSVLQREQTLFRQPLQQKSLNRLLGLGPYKFANLKYDTRRAGDSLLVDRYFYLTPGLPQDFSAELEASTLSTASSSINAGLSLDYTHRNLFGNAEQLQLRGSANAATQLGQEVDFINSINLSARAGLSWPGLIAPFGLLGTEQAWQAKTTASVQADFQRRTGFFSVFSASGSWAYEWQPGRLHRYRWLPFQLTQTNLLSSTPAFDERLAATPRLQASFQNNLILSTQFEYSYSEEEPGKRQNYLRMNAVVEPAGNLAFLARRAASGPQDAPFELLGLPFAQFFRAEGTITQHWFGRKDEWAARLNIGAALPYGNASAIPYIRQFFVGGSNSIRAWQIRALGPGATPVEALDAGNFQDQTGDIKLEANIEYRFPLFSYLKGGLFVDAGNIWLAQGSEPEAVFNWSRFPEQIAVGGGAGLRLDVTYFVLRMDIAAPFRKPYRPAGQRWVFDEMAPRRASWRAQNLVFNLALGYPF
ncbi:translocation and assembly module lipoprotein TamL [Phaeodactylibacter luteus]|nr:BamA/TamA family outer membrane protein [Phaeodactylibacter luteus]